MRHKQKTKKAIETKREYADRMEAKLQRVLNEILEKHPDGNISVAMVANQAGVSRGTIYRHKEIFDQVDAARERYYEKFFQNNQ